MSSVLDFYGTLGIEGSPNDTFFRISSLSVGLPRLKVVQYGTTENRKKTKGKQIILILLGFYTYTILSSVKMFKLDL